MTVEQLARAFPSGFAFGAATAAYQIEGSAHADGRRPSIWDTFSRTPGRTMNGETGDVACDHYRRWEQDLDLMADLGLRAYRFSVAWPRVQPEGSGGANVAGLDFYDRLVDGLMARGIEPWITLYHWDLPQPLEDLGGWTNTATADRLADFAGLVATRLGDRVRHWITLNEPRTHSAIGYGTGRHAPGRHGWNSALRAAHTLHLGHRAAMAAIRAAVRNALVGVCHDVADAVPASGEPADREAAVRHDEAMHRWFLDPTFGRGYPENLVRWYETRGMLEGVAVDQVASADPLDFLAVNYYRRERIQNAAVTDDWGIGSRVVEGLGETTGNGWEVHPPGLRSVLNRISKDYAPPALAITENGATYPEGNPANGVLDDEPRRSYLERHLDAAALAIEDGVPLVGYFAWSLLDNYEWALGYGTRFGIVHVDFETQMRTVKASGRWYAELIAAHRAVAP